MKTSVRHSVSLRANAGATLTHTPDGPEGNYTRAQRRRLDREGRLGRRQTLSLCAAEEPIRETHPWALTRPVKAGRDSIFLYLP